MTDLVDITELLHGRDAPRPNEGAWSNPDLTLLNDGRPSAPSFPISQLRSFWAEYCVRRAKAASAPVDYVAVSLLAAAGAVLANVRHPKAGADWSEPPLLWCGLVGSPSSGKSPGMETVLDLLRVVEEQMSDRFNAELRQYKIDCEAAAACHEAWKTKVKAAETAGESIPTCPIEADAPERPIRQRVRVSDATVEKLGTLAAALDRGLLLVRDELSGWFGGFDRYSGHGADRAFAIEMYGGRTYTIDRVKHPEPVHIRRLSIGVLGGIQPDKLEQTLKGADDGLVSRFLWAWPEPLPRFALMREQLDNREARFAFGRLAALAMETDEFGKPEPRFVPLSPDAENALEQFGQEMHVRARKSHGMLAGALGKARGHVLRLAAILEFLWWCADGSESEPDAVSVKAIWAASVLMRDYFLPMAERVFGRAAAPAADRNALILIEHLQAAQCEAFNARNLRRQVGGPLGEPKAMEEACKTLVEAGLIRPRARRHGCEVGRRARDYEVHPVMHRQP